MTLNNLEKPYHARRKGGLRGKLPRAPRRLRGPAVAQKYKKFELMLTKRAKAYSSSSSQTVSLSPVFSSQSILGFCAEAEDRKN